MYDCGLRPGEAVMLRMAGPRLRADEDGWGEIQLTAAAVVQEKQQVGLRERSSRAGQLGDRGVQEAGRVSPPRCRR